MILVALADNCPLMRRAVRDLLAHRSLYQLLWHAGTPAELFANLARRRPDVLILEPAIAGNGSTLRLVENLRAQYSSTPILVYTNCAHQDTAVSSLQLGAAGFLSKDSPEDELISAIQKLAGGQRYLSYSMLEHVAALHQSTGRDRKVILSASEQQVLEGLAEGHPLTVIAKELSCSAKTVSTHRARLLNKLGLHSNAELFRYLQNATLPHPSPSPSPRLRR
jgi:DNA-binding NarL/FixJ family response regulator